MTFQILSLKYQLYVGDVSNGNTRTRTTRISSFFRRINRRTQHIKRLYFWLHTHTLIPLIGFYSGWSINRLLKIISNGAIAGIVGIVLAHIIADFIAAMADPNLKSAAYGIVLGGFLPLLAVPFLEKYVTKSRYHTVVGDHDDLKKDLKRKHK